LVDNLHARLQTQMYDVQGVPWTNIPKQVASPIHNVSTTGTAIKNDRCLFSVVTSGMRA
jgi:hypothetical protein